MTPMNSVEIRRRLVATCGTDIMIDRAVCCEDGSWLGHKFISAAEPCFQGHFPGHPILPGVHQIEAMAQLAQLAASTAGRASCLAGLRRVKFRRPVHPGDILTVHLHLNADGITASASTMVDGAVTCQADLSFTETVPPPVCGPIVPFTPREGAASLDCEAVMAIIPHRFPFMLVDRLYWNTDEAGTCTSVTGIKNVTMSETSFAGGRPYLASTLLLEMCAQAGCVYALSVPENKGKIGYFMAIDDAEIHRSVEPGSQICFTLTELNLRGRIGTGRADLFVGDINVGGCLLKFALVQPDA